MVHNYEALSEIFTGDIEGGDELYHHSVFPDTDLVMWMIMFYHPHESNIFTFLVASSINTTYQVLS